MLGVRKYLLPALLLVAVLSVCGKLLLTDVKTTSLVGDPLTGKTAPVTLAPGVWVFFDRGWPWPFMDKIESTPPAPNLVASSGGAPVSFSTYQSGNATMAVPAASAGPTSYINWFSWPMLIADLAVCLAILGLCVSLLVLQLRRHGQVRFSLLTMMLFVAMAGIAMGWWMYVYDRWHREQTFFEVFPGVQVVKNELGPRWTRAIFSPNDLSYLCRAQEIQISGVVLHSDGDRTLFRSMIPRLPAVHSAKIKGDYTDQTLDAFRYLPDLKVLTLENYDFTDAGLAYLETSPALEEFRLNGHFSKVTDTGVRSLCRIKSLRKLSLFSCHITDAAIDPILGAPWLEELDLSCCGDLSEQALLRLTEMPNLKVLIVNKRPRLTEKTRSELESHIKTVVTN